ncbi:uroporphyrinogen-III C-methyltransferase [Anaeromicropila herbilytica]|nr:uroporphyrinogen-III C-methyltransferase [Anaeromicropila herbilytica]
MVYLVGAGPGDIDLLTRKGERLLRTCEVVIYDRLVSMELLDFVPKTCERIYVGKTVGNHAMKQEEINEIIIKKALENKKVLRLKGGDPFVFGRGGEEVLALQKEKIPYEVVPGVTSVTSCLAYAGIPITHRGSSNSFHVITGHTKDSDNQLTDNYEYLAKLDGTLVFLMGMGNLDRIVEQLIAYGKDKNTPVAIIYKGTTIQQKVVRGTLDTIYQKVLEQKIKSPSIIVVGDVAGLHMEKIHQGVLNGIRIGITGTNKLTDKLKFLLEDNGAKVLNLSFLKVEEIKEEDSLYNTIHRIGDYNWIVFTSTNGVEVFFHRLLKEKIDYRIFSNMKFAVVGKGTEEALLRKGFQADYMPTKYTTKDLGEGLKNILKKEESVLLVRAKEASIELVNILKEANIQYHDLAIYDLSIDEEKKNSVLEYIDDIDVITFASSSGVRSLLGELSIEKKEQLRQKKIVCIGDITAKTLESYGYDNYIIAEEYTADGMVEKIVESYTQKAAKK